MQPVLVVMAAGMGSRFGGLKQMTPINDQEELILDFSVYDALQAGFKKVVFVIREDMEADFCEIVASRIISHIGAEYVFQRADDLPDGFSPPDGRTKPWGTGHAVWTARRLVDGPFAVINADDFYGREAFELIFKHLSGSLSEGDYAMVGYRLGNTLTEHGSVSRGVCETEDGYLTNVQERVRIEKREEGAAYSEDAGMSWIPLSADSIVSVNMWGFTADFMDALTSQFEGFLSEPSNREKEFYLPSAVKQSMDKKLCTVKVLDTDEKWYGVTYRDDRAGVTAALDEMKRQGQYPRRLWG